MSVQPDMALFEFGHLREGRIRDTSELFHNFATELYEGLPDMIERGVALRKLLEAKDAAVRCAVMMDKELE